MEILTKDEIIELTGYKATKKQIEKLQDLHYPVQGINRFGVPIVIYKDVFGFRRDGLTQSPKAEKTKWQPPPL